MHGDLVDLLKCLVLSNEYLLANVGCIYLPMLGTTLGAGGAAPLELRDPFKPRDLPRGAREPVEPRDPRRTRGMPLCVSS